MTSSNRQSSSAHLSPYTSTRLGSVLSVYRAIALLLNTVLFFVLLNVALGIIFYFKDRSQQTMGSRGYPKANLAKVYSHLSEKEWTTLLTEMWSLALIFEPFTQIKEKPLKGKYVNISQNGFRMTKHQGPWPPDPSAFNVFFFGGSTTFGFGVRDEETIASFLQEHLRQQGCASTVYVYNFGHITYYSSQERILFSRLLVARAMPGVAIFFDGINEFAPRTDEPSFTAEFRSKLGPQFLTERSRPLVYLDLKWEMPLFRAARSARERLEGIFFRIFSGASNQAHQLQYEMPDVSAAIERYLRNKALIEAMADRFGVETLFVWQPSPAYGYDLRYHLFPPSKAHVEIWRQGYGEFNQARLRLPRQEQEGLLWLGDLQSHKREPLYVDQFHYTPSFSQEIAAEITKALLVRKLCQTGRAMLKKEVTARSIERRT